MEICLSSFELVYGGVMGEKPLSVEDAVDFLRISRGHLYNLMYQNKIPYYKPEGKLAYFKKEDLEEFVFRNRHGADYELSKKADAILNRSS
jgi:excisionase family DNA binding protein